MVCFIIMLMVLMCKAIDLNYIRDNSTFHIIRLNVNCSTT